MKLTFCGAAGTVTGSCHLIELDNIKILVDCGMFQGGSEADDMNFEQFKFDPSEIDLLILSHAHIDHSGRIPQLVNRGFKGKIITSAPSHELCRIMLPDSAFIQESEAEWQNRKNQRAGKKTVEPLYTVKDAEAALEFFQSVEYNKVVNISTNVSVRLRDAGHILGSAILEIWVREKGEEFKIVFSGDLGNRNVPIMNDPTIIEDADYVVMESTYGDRLHESSGDKMLALQKIIMDTLARNGNVVIPSFAIERTQEILYVLNMLKESKDSKIRNVPVYVDSPLAVNATKIFRKYLPYFDEEAQKLIEKGDDPFDFPNLILTQTADESKAINASTESCIIISASGMCEAGRIKHHLKHNLWRKESSVVFVGYQAQNTLGRRIKDGEKTVKIFGEEIGVKCSVHSIEGFSGHADQKGLMDWLGSFSKKPQKVFLVHGEEESLKTLSKLIDTQLGIPNEVAVLGHSVELTATTATKTTVERPKINKDAVLKTLNTLKSEVAKTLENTEVRLTADEYVKIDALMYMLEKLQDNITEIKREIS